jgi:hypothetical protein
LAAATKPGLAARDRQHRHITQTSLQPGADPIKQLAGRHGGGRRRRACRPRPDALERLDGAANICSHGRPRTAYGRFLRALDSGNEVLILSAARQLPRVALNDALRICLVLRDGDPDRYERAAVRWLGRFALEARDVTVNAIRGAAEALDDLPDQPAEAMERLQRLCIVHGLS